MSFIVEVVSKEPVLFGESPLWDSRRGQLVFSDCFGKKVCLFDPETGEIISKEVKLPGEEFLFINKSIPYASSTTKFSITVSSGKIVEFDWDKGSVTKVLYDCKSSTVNYSDGKCDGRGRLWTGSGRYENLDKLEMAKDEGKVYRISKSEKNEGTLDSSTELGMFDLPNGLGFNKEQTLLFWNDITQRVVNVFDFDLQNGKLSNRKVLLDFKEESSLDGSYPDGLCVDTIGNLWIACWKGACVIKIDGSNGKLLEKISLPVTNTTSVAFGGKDYDKLFVTTTSIELSSQPVLGQPDAGKLFQITCPQDSSFRGFQEHFLDL